ncbi:hypothetical protein CRW07_22945 [Salmonella enterica]|nr:hypothetical protein [Salmonella enterica]EAM3112734.1 hypothetical protein [Salmonella enterica]EAM4663371.1 hypothetical protein [Salmonella enterica]EAQ6665235.1 hypothetical protein [Salmonella enterica]EAW0878482.1 hypothetical protein [Salmonella enterica]
MSEVNEILKKVTASIEEATGKFNAKAEEALTEAKKNGKLSAETKETVDKMATEFNALKEAEKTLKAALGELEQHVAQMPLANAKMVVKTVGQQVISAEAIKVLSSSIEGNKRISVPVNAALISSDVPEGIVEPQRLPGIGGHEHTMYIGPHGHVVIVDADGNAETTVKNIAFNYIVRLA